MSVYRGPGFPASTLGYDIGEAKIGLPVQVSGNDPQASALSRMRIHRR
jgi:hypothetical protein